jgi:hypothetical protein
MKRALGPDDTTRLRWESLLKPDTVQAAYRGERIKPAAYAALVKAATKLRIALPPEQPT